MTELDPQEGVQTIAVTKLGLSTLNPIVICDHNMVMSSAL